ncbi:MAG: hypothetical protein KAT43_01470 [Nanoarchaeota archaeon]|nr:hypothetical protein [Nanoarchaeota archaeon]
MTKSGLKFISDEKYNFISDDKKLVSIRLREADVIATDRIFVCFTSKNDITTVGSIPLYSPRDIRELIKTDQQVYRLMQRAWGTEDFNKTLAVYKYLKVYLHHKKEGRQRALIEDLTKIRIGMDISDVLGEKEVRALKHRDIGCRGSWGCFIQSVEKNLEEIKEHTPINAKSIYTALETALDNIHENSPEKIKELKEKHGYSLDNAWEREKERILKLNFIEQKAGLNLADFVMY